MSIRRPFKKILPVVALTTSLLVGSNVLAQTPPANLDAEEINNIVISLNVQIAEVKRIEALIARLNREIKHLGLSEINGLPEIIEDINIRITTTTALHKISEEVIAEINRKQLVVDDINGLHEQIEEVLENKKKSTNKVQQKQLDKQLEYLNKKLRKTIENLYHRKQ